MMILFARATYQRNEMILLPHSGNMNLARSFKIIPGLERPG